MRVGAILEFSRGTLPQLLCRIPDLLRDDGFMGISENDQLVLGCLTAFLDFEILADRLAKDRVPQIFLTVKNIAYGRIVPAIGVVIGRVAVVLRLILLAVCRRNQHLVTGQGIGDLRQPCSMCSHIEDLADNGGGFFVYI